MCNQSSNFNKLTAVADAAELDINKDVLRADGAPQEGERFEGLLGLGRGPSLALDLGHLFQKVTKEGWK